jgi:hypothetical protein
MSGQPSTSARLKKGIRIAAAVCWAVILIGWAVSGFRGGRWGWLEDAYGFAKGTGEIIGILAGILVLLTLFGSLLEAAFFGLILAVMSISRLLRKGATNG